jgi:glycosyltransferase involved in cell wall biosynthesis
MTCTAAGRPGPSDFLTALDQRLAEAATVLLGIDDAGPPGSRPPGTLSGQLLPQLIALCTDSHRSDARWLVLTAAFGAFPTIDQLMEFGRSLELAPTEHTESALLAQVISDSGRGRVDLPMTIVSRGTVLDVDFCARYDTHTGIHRVVRETMPRWNAEHTVTAVAWIDQYSAFRTLAPREVSRVFTHAETTSDDLSASEAAYRPHLVVPWRSVLVLADVPNPRSSSQLAALAKFSGNTLSMIGYDMIPITSAELRPPADANAFAQYLTVVKHAHRVAGISRSAAAEFAGFTHSLKAQGLSGPEVREVLLAGEVSRPTCPRSRQRGDRPVMLCVGSQEPHKNQRTALHAAERLWREGLQFDLRLVGGPGWSDAVLRPAIERLVHAERSITALGRVGEEQLLDEMRSADFVIFASLHEGYGLPVAEALACGTPVITSNFGSQLEIAELGGCLVVDPRDDDEVTDAVRRLLTMPDELQRLRGEAAARRLRTWDEYASDLWAFLGARDEVA